MKAETPCRKLDPELWFPVGKIGPAVRQAEQAKALCHTCPVEMECLRRALAWMPEGIWGGTDEQERKLIREAGKETPGPMAQAR